MVADKHTFECACKSVEVQITGSPMYGDYCHCNSCCKWNQQRPVGIVLYPKDSLEVLKGSEEIKKVCLSNPPDFERLFCGKCGYKLYGQHAKMGFRSLPAGNLETLDFKPVSHVFCSDGPKGSLTRFKDDGLPKWAMLPPQFGGPDKQVEV